MTGRSPKTPAPTDPMATAKANDWAAQQQHARDLADKAAADKAAADKLAAQKATTAADVSRLFGEGQSYGQQQLGALGYADTYGIMDNYLRELNAAKGRVPTTATDVGSYFNNQDMWKTALAESTSAQTNKLDTALRNLTPAGWTDKYFGSTADDAILNSILSEQQGTASSALQTALARGQISQPQYDAAAAGLANKSTSAMATLQDLGGGVLSKYKTGLTDLANTFSNAVTNYKLGQNVNSGDWQNQIKSTVSGYQGNMRGDILKALGDTKLFDPNALIASGAVAGGATNQPSTPQNAPTEEEKQRTQSTAGVF